MEMSFIKRWHLFAINKWPIIKQSSKILCSNFLLSLFIVGSPLHDFFTQLSTVTEQMLGFSLFRNSGENSSHYFLLKLLKVWFIHSMSEEEWWCCEERKGERQRGWDQGHLCLKRMNHACPGNSRMTAAPDFHILMKPKKWDGWHFIGHGNGTYSSDEIKKEALFKQGGGVSICN